MTKRLLFLDLEDTVIEPVMKGWHNTGMINEEKLKKFIADYNPDSIHIFSFAIWDEDQKGKFMGHTKMMIEQALGIKITGVPTVEDIIHNVCRVQGIPPSSMDFDDLSTFYGKQHSFHLCMRHLYAGNSTPVELTFLDDAVYNEACVWPDIQVTLRILNIDTLKE